MARLMFEDDSGKLHEVKMDTLKTKSLGKDDKIMVTYEVGDASQQEAHVALSQLKVLIEKIFYDNESFVVATRHGKKDIDINIIKQKE